MAELVTERLLLQPIKVQDVEAVLGEAREPSWAPDFPADGDRVIARLLQRSGLPDGAGLRYGHRLVIERDGGRAVGGIGVFGPPESGAVEIGYGIVPSRRQRGYATEAVRTLLADLWSDPAVMTVRARVELDNPASIRVLQKAGFMETTRDGGLATYQRRRTR